MASRTRNAAGLTPQEATFVENYLFCNCNGTEALRRGGHPGTPEVLRATAARLLPRVNVQRALEEKRKEMAMGALEVIARHAEIARSTLDDFMNPTTNELDLARARERGKLHLLKEIVYREIPTKEGMIHEKRVKLHDAQAAQVTLMKYHGLLTEVLAIKDMPKTEEELIDAVMREVRRVTGEPAPAKKVKA